MILPLLQHLTFCPVGFHSLYVYLLSIFFSDPVLISTLTKAEHHVLYQYRLVNAANHYMGLIQTESVSTINFMHARFN